MKILVCLYYTVLSVPCSLVITCWERADLLALFVCEFPCVFFTFPYDITGQVWNLILSIPGLYPLVYLHYSTNSLYDSVAVYSFLLLPTLAQSELPRPIPEIPYNQTSDVHRGSTLIT